jgi:acyl carrier protein
MEKILIDWLTHYTNRGVTLATFFEDLNFDVFDEAMTVDFVDKQFKININTSDVWFVTVKDLVDAIASRT